MDGLQIRDIKPASWYRKRKISRVRLPIRKAVEGKLGFMTPVFYLFLWQI